MIQQARLVIEGRSNWVYTHPLSGTERVTIGRGADNTIDTKDPHTSANHAEIYVRDGRYFIKDLGSRNGTLIDGKKIQDVRLRNGVAIRIGQTTMSFLTEEDTSLTGLVSAHSTATGELKAPESALDGVDSAIQRMRTTPPAMEPRLDHGAYLSSVLEDVQRELRQARSEVRMLRIANEFALTLALDRDPYAMLANGMAFMGRELNAENGFLMQLDAATGRYIVRARHGAISDWHRVGEGGAERLPVSLTLVKEALTGGKTIHTDSAVQDERFGGAESVNMLGIKSCMCVPFTNGTGKPSGACYLDRRANQQPYGAEDVRLFETLVAQFGRILHPAA